MHRTHLRTLGFLIALPLLAIARLAAGEPSAPESLLFVGASVESATATVLRIPSAPPVLRSATREITYAVGIDFEWQPGTRGLRLLPGSRISWVSQDQLYPPANSPNSYSHRRGSDQWMLFGPGRFFHDLQCVAEYESDDEWLPPVTPAAPEEQLGRLRARLAAQQPVTIVMLGDSISTEADASLLANAPPLQPGYPTLVAHSLREQFGSDVRLVNLSVGGMDSNWGISQVDKVLAEKPQLVLIAFGMNDASGRRTPADFAAKTKQIIDPILAALPECEIVLVSSMTANSEWVHSAPELYGQYAEALRALCGPRVALADVTTVWQAIDARKQHLDLTGNGLNHPNDYGHRIYAEVVLATLGDAEWLRLPPPTE
jgi:acyl-CoA thioesterase-1